MARAKTTVCGRAPLARDSQQWMLDYLIQETGKVFHFQGEGRGRLPRSVRNHDMISKHLGLQARRLEALAKAEAGAGHGETALDFYFQATVLYAGAQHIIFESNDEKRYLYAGVRRCYDEVIALAPYRIEHVDIPWNGTLVSGNLHSISLASFWGLRFAARDRRIRAIAAPAASCCEKYFLMDLESPRWKQLFAYLTQSRTEAELDAVMGQMTLEGYMAKIACPTLLAVGEYDPRGPLDEVYRMFDQLTAPAELWVFADQHHMPAIGGGEGVPNWTAPLNAVMCDWLRDRLADKPLRHPGQVVYVEANSAGPNSATVALKRKWYES